MFELRAAGRDIGRRQRELTAVGIDIAAVYRIAGRIAQITVGTAHRIVAPPAQRVTGAQHRRKIVGQLGLGVVLNGVDLIGCRQDQPVLVARIFVGNGTGHRCATIAAAADGAAAEQLVGKRDRLSIDVEPADIEPPRPVAARVAQRGAGLLSAIGGGGAVLLVSLTEAAQFGMRFELFRHPRHIVDHRADRIAGIGRRERTIQHVDALDFFRRHQAPARRVIGAVAEQVGQQDAIRVYQRACAIAGA